jgi:hypothetical protein
MGNTYGIDLGDLRGDVGWMHKEKPMVSAGEVSSEESALCM